MFSVIFPGQGSQVIGMGKDFFDKYNIVKELFLEADDALGISLSKIIMDGPKEELDLTVNTQPAIFLISYSIFQVVKKEFNINLNEAKFFAGHSLGEYSALSAANYLNFSETIKLLKVRGEAMQNAVPNGEGGMLAVLGSTIEILEQIITENKNNFIVQIANDNSEGQIVLSGKNTELLKLVEILKSKNIKNIKLPVSAPFHCYLMSKATEVMKKEIENTNFQDSKNILISNELFWLNDKLTGYFSGLSLVDFGTLPLLVIFFMAFSKSFLPFAPPGKSLFKSSWVSQKLHIPFELNFILGISE